MISETDGAVTIIDPSLQPVGFGRKAPRFLQDLNNNITWLEAVLRQNVNAPSP